MASSEFFKDGLYDLESEGRKLHAARSSPTTSHGLVDRYPIITIEDGMARRRLGRLGAADAAARRKVQLVGDDLFVTNTKILSEGIARGIANSILIKPNQIGTLTETLAAIDMAARGGLHRGGLASLGRDRGQRRSPTSRSATRATQIKTGSLSRSDRIAKYNQLLRIEAELGADAKYAGRAAFPVAPCRARLRQPMALRIIAALLLVASWRCSTGCGCRRTACATSGAPRQAIEVQNEENDQLAERNRTLAAEVQDLKKGARPSRSARAPISA